MTNKNTKWIESYLKKITPEAMAERDIKRKEDMKNSINEYGKTPLSDQDIEDYKEKINSNLKP